MRITLHAILFFSLFSMSYNLNAQADSSWQQKPTLSIMAFVDAFYAFDFDQPRGNNRQVYFYNHNRHNEFNLNLGLIKLSTAHPKYRANLALQTGTYAIDNYAEEPVELRNIFEANVGVSLNKKNSLWLDAGVLPSHIGFESAISIDNLTLTRSLLAENSPYFLTGAKLTYQVNEKLKVAGLILNGWQRIQREDRNSTVSFGTQVNYKVSDNTTVNWSTFIGRDGPDGFRFMRYFNNVYGRLKVSEKLEVITGFDIGLQQREKASNVYSVWYSIVAIGRYTLNERWKTGFRIESYEDNDGVIVPTNRSNNFQATGFSVNLDYVPYKNIACRIESRWLEGKDRFFRTSTRPSKRNFAIVGSIAIKFSETFFKK